MSSVVTEIEARVAEHAPKIQALRTQLRRVIVGQKEMVNRLLTALLTGGHILLEGVPGLAKTTAIKALAQSIDTQFRRIQFTPDLLPADLIGTLIYNPALGQFTTRKGPIFANFILADEINRAPSKVQSALLEAMQERQVTIGDETYGLDRLFLVMATQNPIEQEGTYPLPEAQVDRFMLKVVVHYPEPKEEREVLDQALDGTPIQLTPVLHPEDIFQMQEVVRQIYVDPNVRDYILNLVIATREPRKFNLGNLEPLIEFGASPRATLFLGIAARAHAFLQSRGYITPQDVKDIAPDVLRHRILLSYEAEAEQISPDDVIQKLLRQVRVP